MSDPAGTAVRRRKRFVGTYVVLALAILVVLELFGAPTPETFFVGAFVGYLLLVELTASSYLRPRWREPLRWPALLGYVVVGLLAVRYLLDVVRTAMGVVPLD